MKIPCLIFLTMDELKIKKWLAEYKQGHITEKTFLENLKDLPFESIDYANIDHHRGLRTGFPEVIFCEGKTSEQIIQIAKRILSHNGKLLATRASHEQYKDVIIEIPDILYHEKARAMSLKIPEPGNKREYVLVITAGTSDIPVAEEALITVRVMGHRAEHLYDVGVAGIHRLFAHLEIIKNASVIVVVAGMEGALASVVGGLTDKLVVAVPTSIGYGSSFGGMAALLTMLNSCAAGVTVVNIDNGFGAGVAASLVMRSLNRNIET